MRCNMSVAVNQQRKEQTPMIGGLSCISVYREPNGTPNAVSKCCEGSRGLDSKGDNVVGSSPLKGNDEDQSVVSCSSSSTGENSSSGDPSTLTSCNEDGLGADVEVQSSYKSPLDDMSKLEESLPIKRGISKFFSGKSRSFTSLSDAVSIKDLVKPDNPYSKRRRTLLACSNNWDRQRFYPSRNSSAGISKKGYHSSKSTLAVAISMSNSQNNVEGYEHDLGLPPLPPLPRPGKPQSTAAAPRSFSVRSFSLTDLQGIGCRPSFARF